MNIRRVIRQIEKEEKEAEIIRILALSLQERFEVENHDYANYWSAIKTIETILYIDSDKMTDKGKLDNIKNIVKEVTACS